MRRNCAVEVRGRRLRRCLGCMGASFSSRAGRDVGRAPRPEAVRHPAQLQSSQLAKDPTLQLSPEASHALLGVSWSATSCFRIPSRLWGALDFSVTDRNVGYGTPAVVERCGLAAAFRGMPGGNVLAVMRCALH